MTAGQISDYTGAVALLHSLPKVQWLLTDRRYDADWFRDAKPRKRHQTLHPVAGEMADRPDAIVPVHAAATEKMLFPSAYCTYWLIEEVSTSINTTAAGGNASLIAMA